MHLRTALKNFFKKEKSRLEDIRKDCGHDDLCSMQKEMKKLKMAQLKSEIYGLAMDEKLNDLPEKLRTLSQIKVSLYQQTFLPDFSHLDTNWIELILSTCHFSYFRDLVSQRSAPWPIQRKKMKTKMT